MKCLRPYFLHCSPCIANFTSVIKLENREETEHLLQIIGLDKQQLEWRNKGDIISKGMVEVLINTLSCFERLELFQRYLPDFELFEYETKTLVSGCL